MLNSAVALRLRQSRELYEFVMVYKLLFFVFPRFMMSPLPGSHVNKRPAKAHRLCQTDLFKMAALCRCAVSIDKFGNTTTKEH